MRSSKLICFLISVHLTRGMRQKIRSIRTNDSHVEMNSSHRVADRATNSGCKCSSDCGGEPQKWCRTEDKCGNPPAPIAVALGYWDYCDNPRAAEYAVELTCNCINRHSHSVMGMAGQMIGGGDSITRPVTRELGGYWENLPKSKVGGLGGRGDAACHQLCPKMCCSAWERDKEKKGGKLPMYDGYDKCTFDVVGKIGNRWWNHMYLSRHGALTMHEAGKYIKTEPSNRGGTTSSIVEDPEAACMHPGCSVYTGDLSKVYIKGCPDNPRAKTAWGEVAGDVAMAVGDFFTPQFQAPRLGLGNANPQLPNLGGMGAMGGMAARAYFG